MRLRAKNLRNNSTAAEIILWQELKNSRPGAKFRRQQPLDHYVADFYCPALKLIIEIDGNSHDFAEINAKDKSKEKYLGQQGYQALRFTDSDIKDNLEAVLIQIRNHIDASAKSPPQNR